MTIEEPNDFHRRVAEELTRRYAASEQALEAGRRARPLAELAWKQVERSRAQETRRG